MLVDELRAALHHGAVLHLGFVDGRRVWWCEDPAAELDDAIVREAARGHNGQPLLEEAGDSLFHWAGLPSAGFSQTWYNPLCR